MEGNLVDQDLLILKILGSWGDARPSATDESCRSGGLVQGRLPEEMALDPESKEEPVSGRGTGDRANSRTEVGVVWCM